MRSASSSHAPQHSLSILAESNPSIVEWLLLAFQAIVSAALIEELLFRGVLLSWLRRATPLAHFVVAGLTVLLTFNAMLLTPEEQARRHADAKTGFATPRLKTATQQPQSSAKANNSAVVQSRSRGKASATKLADLGVAKTFDPMAWAFRPGLVLFQVIVLSFYLGRVSRRHGSGDQSDDMSAILGSAILFAAFHSVWPHQIPLLVLGLGLAWLTCRTSSLVGAIVVHALFNAVPCVFLIVQRVWSLAA